MISRRQFLTGIIGGAATAGGAVGYGMGIEAHWLEVTEKTVTLPPSAARGPALRLAHLSDLHASRWCPPPYLHSAVQQTLERKPDFVCLTGDFFTCKETWVDQDVIDCLKPLARAVPTFASLGNHDGGPFTAQYRGEPNHERIGAVLAQSGISWLQNRTVDFRIRGRPVRLTGLGDLWNNDCRPEIAFAGVEPDPSVVAIAMSHNPDSKEFLLPYPWHLLLSGHTHGGQCGIPGIGRELAPVTDKEFIAGLYPYLDRQVHITRGVGNLHGIRILCRPEVSLLTVT